MKFFHRAVSICRWILRRDRAENELNQELEAFIDLSSAGKVREGMSPAQARRAAMIELGGLEQTKESVRVSRHGGWLDEVGRDIRFGCRLLRKQPQFTLTVGATLAICLGANAALFAIVNQVLLRPLPIAATDRVLITGNRYPKAGADSGYSTSAGDYIDRLQHTDVFEEQALFKPTNRTIDESGVPTRVPAMSVTPSFFRLVRVPPRLGRTFDEGEAQDGNDQKTVLSYALWQAEFGAQPSAVGKTLRIDGRPHEIVGVMPQTFALIAPNVLLWTPITLTAADRTSHYNDVWGYIARLTPQASIGQARSQIDAINRANLERLAENKHLITDTGFYTAVDGLQDALVKDVRPALYLMWGGALFVLLIGFLNVTNLALARSGARAKELATRLAFGASPARIARQLMTESVVLTIGSTAVGLVIGWMGLRALGSVGLEQLPSGTKLQFDASAVAFTTAAGAVIGLLLGLLSALSALSGAPSTALGDEPRAMTTGPATRRLRRTLVATQVAFAFVLLLGAGLLFTSFRKVLAIDPGFAVDHVFTASVSMPATEYGQPLLRLRFAGDVLGRLRALPFVLAAGVTDTIPFGTQHTNSAIMAEGYQMRPGESIVSPTRAVASTGYFEAMRAHLIAGRFFNEHDTIGGTQVVIVDQTLANRFWPGTSAIGRRLYRPGNVVGATPDLTFTVVGVIAPMKLVGLIDSGQSAGAYYFPYEQRPVSAIAFAARTTGDPGVAETELRNAIHAVNPEIAVFDMQSMEQSMAKSFAGRRSAMLLSLTFSAVALFLAAVGIYGLLAYLMEQRRKEIGIRLALGSSARMVFRLVMRDGLIVTALGGALGAIGVLALKDALQSQLVGVAVVDPIVLILVSVLLISVATTACALPAWRASRTDPRVAMSS